MRLTFHLRRLLCLLAAPAMIFTSHHARAAAPPAGRPYSLTISGTMQGNSPERSNDTPVELKTKAQIDYLIDLKDDRQEVSLHSESVSAEQDGKLIQELSMSRARFRVAPSRTDVEFDKASPQLQQIMLSFDTPILTRTVDPNGKEIGRKILAEGPLAKLHVEMVDTIFSIHVPFPEKERTWTTLARLAMGQGNSAAGTLKFEKVGPPAGPNSPVKVKVSGELAATATGGQLKIKNSRYSVNGEQTYDPVSKGWTAAHWVIDISLELVDAQDKPLSGSKGKLDLVMTLPVATSSLPSPAGTPAAAKVAPPATQVTIPAEKPEVVAPSGKATRK